MCGLCGLFNLTNEPVNGVLVQRMASALKKRGPDGEGIFVKGPVGLGHRRLAIIDLLTGDQPLFNEDKTLALVFNGEIYNYQELEKELTRHGHRFVTKSDTEVIVHAYEEWGVECVRRFNGMWAFALWDSRKQGLFISRDRIGEKPLFYVQQGKSFLFASEIKGLLAAGFVTEPATELINIYLALGYIPAPYSFYRGIKKLLPGHSLWVDKDGVKESCYWKLPYIPEKEMERDAQKAEQQFEEIFRDAIRLRTRADVPFGAFLSGGLDSSCVVAGMSTYLASPVPTFTIGFPVPEFDEREQARLVAAKWHSLHHETVITQENFPLNVDEVLECYDEPFGDSSALPVGKVAEFTRTRVKMALTGDGGDEVLSGYPAYQVEKGMGRYKQVPAFLRRAANSVWQTLKPLAIGNKQYTWNRIARLLNVLEEPFIERLAAKTFYVAPDILNPLTAGLGKQIDPIEFIRERLAVVRSCDTFYQLMHFHFSVSLPDDMLAKVDRMTMYHSLEVRLPFLDHRLVELCAGLHKDVKMRGFERKSLLRRTIGRQLPHVLLRSGKKGFVVPFREWFREAAFQPYLNSLKELSTLGFARPILEQIIRSHMEREYDYGPLLWELAVLKRWFEKNSV